MSRVSRLAIDQQKVDIELRPEAQSASRCFAFPTGCFAFPTACASLWVAGSGGQRYRQTGYKVRDHRRKRVVAVTKAPVVWPVTPQLWPEVY